MSHLKFGPFIRDCREKKGIKQAFVASKAGISPQALCSIEKTRWIPGLEVTMVLLEAIGESLETFSKFLKEEDKVTQIDLNPKKFENYNTHLPCQVCGRLTENGNTFHHIISQKNLGPDEDWNLLPLCLEHLNEVHAIGRSSFAGKYYAIESWMKKRGWELDHNGKWRH